MIEFHPRAAEELRQALIWYRAKCLRSAEGRRLGCSKCSGFSRFQ